MSFSARLAALIVKWSPQGDSYTVAVGNKVVVYKLAVSTFYLHLLVIKVNLEALALCLL